MDIVKIPVRDWILVLLTYSRNKGKGPGATVEGGEYHGNDSTSFSMVSCLISLH